MPYERRSFQQRVFYQTRIINDNEQNATRRRPTTEEAAHRPMITLARSTYDDALPKTYKPMHSSAKRTISPAAQSVCRGR